LAFAELEGASAGDGRGHGDGGGGGVGKPQTASLLLARGFVDDHVPGWIVRTGARLDNFVHGLCVGEAEQQVGHPQHVGSQRVP